MMTDENAGPGREIHKGKVNLIWGGVWLDIGEAEFLVENGQVVKVISFTPKDSTELPTVELEQTTREIDEREVTEDPPGVFSVPKGVGLYSEEEARRLGGY